MITLAELDAIMGCKDPNILLEWNGENVIHYHGFRPVIFKEGKGARIRDIGGREYIDFVGQAFCVNIGYGDGRVIKYAKEQLNEISTTTVAGLNMPQIRLSRLLAQITPKGLSRSYFVNSGSEAAELAIKTVRRYTQKAKIISLWAGYHGWTLGALSAAGMAHFKRGYEPVAPSFIHTPPPYLYRCDYNCTYPDCSMACARMVENTIIYEGPGSIAAVMMEPIIGGGGIVVPPDGYLQEVRRICTKYNVPLIFDEVITGFGRTGKLFCSEHYGISPDIMTMGKGITSTYAPLAGVATTDNIAAGLEDYSKGEHLATYENHPLSCAVALANIRVLLEDKLAENAAKMGDYLLRRLEELAGESTILGEARGKGLMLGVEIIKDKQTREPDANTGKAIQDECFKNGLLSFLSRMRLKDAAILCFGPPLCITQRDADDAMNIFSEAVRKTEKAN